MVYFSLTGVVQSLSFLSRSFTSPYPTLPPISIFLMVLNMATLAMALTGLVALIREIKGRPTGLHTWLFFITLFNGLTLLKYLWVIWGNRMPAGLPIFPVIKDLIMLAAAWVNLKHVVSRKKSNPAAAGIGEDN